MLPMMPQRPGGPPQQGPTGLPAQASPNGLPPNLDPKLLLMLLLKILGPQLMQGGGGGMGHPSPQGPPAQIPVESSSPQAPGAGGQGAAQVAPLLEAIRNMQRQAASRSLQGMAGAPPQMR